MIREKALFCKLFYIKKSSKVLFQSYMDKYRPELDTCPYCGARGHCRIHGYYKRRIGEFRDGTVIWEKVNVMRVRCTGCGHTHAILPDVIIPYTRHGVLFIIHALASHFIHHLSVEKACEMHGVSRNQFFRWLSLWRKHKALWLGRLRSRETGDRAFLDRIAGRADYSEFSAGFIRKFAFSFLQSHRNPADYCQQVFSP